MRIAIASLESISPYSQSRHHDTPKLDKEHGDDYDRRTWRERMHADEKTGNVFIPPMAFKNSIAEAAKFLSIQVKGKGKQTYTKHFESGVLVSDPLVLPIKKSEVSAERLFLPSDGKRGGGKRVWKMYPLIREWSGKVRFFVLDDTITEEVFEDHLRQCGQFIGIGRFRPRNNGFYGRFSVKAVEWGGE